MTSPPAPPRAAALPDRPAQAHAPRAPTPRAGTFASRLLSQRPATRAGASRSPLPESDSPLFAALLTQPRHARVAQHASSSAHDDSPPLPAARAAEHADREAAGSATQGASEGVPFRPLPSCVFAPLSQARAMSPAPAPDDLSRLAAELLRSMHVGGTRTRGQVRLVLDTAEGEPLEVTLDECPEGVVATLHGEQGAGSARLVRAIERELARREVAVERAP
ncbi:MAG: hypothetical protein R3B40_10265 [Polyangiales bacterium]|nr:hypothetical protein [Myxococcales bacterium]MCB9657965.1 hypothetical protein [Sandaracinaceae bacterium]